MTLTLILYPRSHHRRLSSSDYSTSTVESMTIFIHFEVYHRRHHRGEKEILDDEDASDARKIADLE